MEAITFMEGLNEHLKLSSGNTLRIQTIELDSFSHDDFWSRVDEIISDYTKIHPIEMEIIVRENGIMAANQYNKHGVSKDKTDSELRHHMRIPGMLMLKLESFCPELFENPTNYHRFMKRYKGLCAYE